MRSVKVDIRMTREDGQHETHTFEVSSSVPVVIDGDGSNEGIDEIEANERIAAHLDAALSAERLAGWLNELDELPEI